MIGAVTEKQRKGSLTIRIVVGLLAGLAVGFAALALLISLAPEAPLRIKLGVVLWYASLGAIIGLVGVLGQTLLLGRTVHWYVQGPIVGGWMNLLLVLFAHDDLAAIAEAALGDVGFWASPYWFVPEGAGFGVVIGGLATLFGGEGPETADD